MIMNPKAKSGALGIERDLTPEQIVARTDWAIQEKLNRLEELKRQAKADDGEDPAQSIDSIEAAIEIVKGEQAKSDIPRDFVRQA